MKTGTLYVVATPSGNLEDMTARALRVLREADLIACEDTRHTRKLLSHFGIGTSLWAYHDHNEREKAPELLERLKQGRDIALVSDAGTPAIADPGYRLVRLCREQGLPVVAVPGPSALTAALSIAGLPTDRFAFEGFLPSKVKARRELLTALAGEPRTLAFYESPHRLRATLEDVVVVLGAEREIAVARELTKMYEECVRGSAAEVAAKFAASVIRGEVVLLIAPAPAAAVSEESVRDALLRWHRTTRLSWKEIVREVARETGLPGSTVYQEHLALKQELAAAD